MFLELDKEDLKQDFINSKRDFVVWKAMIGIFSQKGALYLGSFKFNSLKPA